MKNEEKWLASDFYNPFKRRESAAHAQIFYISENKYLIHVSCLIQLFIMEYGPTLDIGDLSEPLEVSEEIDGSHETQEIWGRLFPLGKGWIGIGTVTHISH